MGRAEDLLHRFRQDGEKLIDEFIANRSSEELFLDFKCSADGGEGVKLHFDDRANLAKAISGFGNSEGGVIIWGVKCRHDATLGDVPTGKCAIAHPERFVSWLENAVSGCTLPPHGGVKHHPLAAAEAGKGYVVTHIPKSSFAPHQCIVGKHKDRYFMRVGSSFGHVPHGVLEGMFGRRPTPSLDLRWRNCEVGIIQETRTDLALLNGDPSDSRTLSIQFDFVLVNSGRSIAQDLYFNCKAAMPNERCALKLHSKPREWLETYFDELTRQLYSPDSYKLAPSAKVSVANVWFLLNPPFERDLKYDATFGCDGSPVGAFSGNASGEELREFYNQVKGGEPLGGDRVQQLLGLDPRQLFRD